VNKRLNILAYVITFSIIGLIVVQYLFIKKERNLLENQYRMSIQQAISKVDNRIKEYEVDNLTENPNSIVAQILRADSASFFGRFSFKSLQNAWCELNKIYEKKSSSSHTAKKNSDSTADSLSAAGGFLNHNSEDLRRLEKLAIYLTFRDLLCRQPIHQRVPADSLQIWLKEEFRERNMNFPFGFAIFNDGIQTVVHNNEFKTGPGYFTVSYPVMRDGNGRNKYVLKVSIPFRYIHTRTFYYLIALGLAFLFILVIVYLITLYQLYKQRYLAKIKNDFINNITHEFKTPIATINLIADTIKSPAIINNPDAIKKYIKNLKNENRRMLDQVEKILTLGKIEQNKWIWKNEPISVNETIEDVIDQLSLILQEKGGHITFEPMADRDIIQGDPVMVHNIFVNLIDNAIKYSKDKPEIQVRTYNKKNYVVAEIKDNGIGMSKTVQKHIFDKFYRKPTGDVHNIKGHGIGLTFVKQVLDRLGADIFVESEPGKGTTFFIYFPLKKPKKSKSPGDKHTKNN